MKTKKIISEFKNQDYKHFDEFYKMTERQVYFSIIKIVKNQDVAADLMQDTYMKFIEKIDQYNDRYNVVAYLATIGRNLAINHYNRSKKEVHNDEVFNYVASKEAVDQNIGILDLLDTLEDVRRDIVILHVIDELKFREIAEIMDMPLGTVQWHYQAAMKVLKEKVGDV